MMDVAGEKNIDVAYVAHLARLRLSEEETAVFQKQLEGIVGYVNKVREIDTTGVEPTAHGRSVQNVFREDMAREGLTTEEVLRNAPAQRDGLFVVPKIVE
ncbi:MAG: Asp-tRNA(Asn)/Glu-tRNA(Gln) amidotransferase subunit GatC [Lentisphaerales bacterium]|jgi:aspartyl-tRNA(Asn)/glutamyl-tRNA(Gln) amidotransferase subunit C|nr:MAG: Asp-tRNA(Asn)/Glu-tRNA(Gln) amidotransferase subunit GatC [Lentisphaerales bacterium]